MGGKTIRCGHGIVLHIHDERKAANFAEAFALGAEKAKKRKELYEGRDAAKRRSLGRFKCRARGGYISG
jgi:hypothetical protein